MSEKTRRRFWQIHLSTAVILTIAAGGLLWLNTIPNSSFAFQLNSPLKEDLIWGDVYWEYGYPFSSYSNVRSVWRFDRMLLNIGASVCVLAIVAILCEYVIRKADADLIRRREGGKR